MLFNFFGNKYETNNSIFQQKKNFFQNAKSMVSCKKREIFHHSHSLFIFFFQSNASVKVSTVTDCTREAAATRMSGLNENNTHELTHGLLSYLINLAITPF